jgi:hypothetical protein
MKKKNYNTVEEFTAAVESCLTIDDALDVLTKSKSDTGDFAYLNIRFVVTNTQGTTRLRLLALFCEADPRFKEFADSGCTQ